MKRFLLSIISLTMACAIALCAVNETLVTAQKMLLNANTVEQCENAKKKFKSAMTDPNYVEAEHKADIDRGIKACDEKIAQLSISLSVSPSNISFGPEGGSTTLSVSTNQGTPTVTTGAGWLTVDSRSARSITLSCAPNNSADSRTASVTVSAGGKTARVTAKQNGASLVISAVEFGHSADAGGSHATGWGEPLYANAVRYVTPRITYTSPLHQTKNISTKIYIAGGPVPADYTQSIDCTLDAGTNTLLYQGYGASSAGSLNPGTYAYEVWVDGTRAYSTRFEIRERFDGIKFSRIEFGSVDANDNQLITYGSPLLKDKACLVKPRIYYQSPKNQRKMVCVKAFNPDGSLLTQPNSPAGYSLSEEVYFQNGTNTIELSGLGWNTPQFEVGDYKYEVWVDDECALSSSFSIKPKQEGIKISEVRFGSTDQNNNWEARPGQPLKQANVLFITPEIHYSSSSFKKGKDVYFKFFDTHGELMTDARSPKGFTHTQKLDFKQGKTSIMCRGRGMGGRGKFAKGTYKVEIWIDNKCLWEGSFVIQ